MGKPAQPERSWPIAVLFGLVLYAVAIAFRPILPVDETRYFSVAWEMWLRHDWLAPLTVNFEPYHHKPPLLFWLINSMWSMFGVNRWSALLPLVAAAITTVLLTGVLCERVLPGLRQRSQLVMLGSLGFLLFTTLVLFDITLTVFVLGALICLLAYARAREARYIVAMGILMGLGVLTKGPVTYLYVLFPILLGPWWVERLLRPRSWYVGSVAALVISLVPVALWLIPVLRSSSGEFAHSLLWEQSVGRVTGSFAASHERPIWFYLPILPVLLVPWVFFSSFWKGIGSSRPAIIGNPGIRFILCWLLPTLVAFSLIRGKQPHYLLPLLPGFAIVVAYGLGKLPKAVLQRTAVAMLAAIVTVYAVTSGTVLDRYDLQPVADVLSTHRTQPIAFVGGHYRGELTFLARLDHPLETVQSHDLDTWFEDHPDGIAILRYSTPPAVASYELVFSKPYRSRRIGIVQSRTQLRPALTGPT